jgi:glutathione synthase/RimK-type ligase-like ATP-grasp enzyme
MRVTLTLNQEIRDYVLGRDCKGTYEGSLSLLGAFQDRGHDVRVVHPNHFGVVNGMPISGESYNFDGERFMPVEKDRVLYGDVFFLYGLGEDLEDVSMTTRFIDLLPSVERTYGNVINSPESTRFDLKSEQRKLNLPWIPSFDVKNSGDLVDLLENGERIIAKPNVGYLGQGIVYLEGKDSIGKIKEGKIGEYIFERFVPSTFERRYAFLDGDFIFARKLLKSGQPGREEIRGAKLISGDEDEREIARRAMEMTGMFFGCLDFRGEYALEINGSGTGVNRHRFDRTLIYDISRDVVKAVEKKAGK